MGTIIITAFVTFIAVFAVLLFIAKVKEMRNCPVCEHTMSLKDDDVVVTFNKEYRRVIILCPRCNTRFDKKSNTIVDGML